MTLKRAIGSASKRILPKRAYYRFCATYDTFFRFSRYLAYKGPGHQCPLCGQHFRRFVAEPGVPSPVFQMEHVIGGGPFEESRCPYCDSSERERHVYLYLREMTDVLRRPVMLLHVAPEARLQPILRRHKNIDYVSADLTSPLAEIKIDLTVAPFAPESFDVVLCNHVLEHIREDRRAMSEILRVLRPGGWALLQVPIAPSRPQSLEDLSIADPLERQRLFGQRDHVRLYGADYRQRLEKVGFNVETTSIREKLGNKSIDRFALIPDEQLYVAHKPGPIRSADCSIASAHSSTLLFSRGAC
jgi:SAM-dependent methyltransferase